MARVYDGFERGMWADSYNFFLKYRDIPDNEYYWGLAVRDCTELCNKYHGHPVMVNIMNQTMLLLESKITNRPIGDFTYNQWNNVLRDLRG